MKATHCVVLNSWITTNKHVLASSDRGTLKDCAEKASGELDFKVPVAALAELMRSQGLETRRLSQEETRRIELQSRIESLTVENLELRRTLAKVAASEYVPDDFKDFLFAGLKEEIKAQIFSTSKRCKSVVVSVE